MTMPSLPRDMAVTMPHGHGRSGCDASSAELLLLGRSSVPPGLHGDGPSGEKQIRYLMLSALGKEARLGADRAL